MGELGQLKLFFEEVVYITKKVGFRHGKTVWPNGDNYGAQLGDGEATWTTFPALYYAPCCFLSPTVPMAQYHTLSRDDHELHDSSDPWNNSDGVLDTVSARPRRAVFSHFINLKCHVLIFSSSCVTYSTTMSNILPSTLLRISFLRVQCHRESRNRKREKGDWFG